MNGKRNLIAHKQVGTSDKVYMACVRHDSSTKEWVVIGKYGRRTAGTLQMVPKMRTAHQSVAYAEQLALFNSKLREGYKDVEESGYNGPVNRSTSVIASNLEEEGSWTQITPTEQERLAVEATRKAREKSKQEAKPEVREPEEDTIVCVDNSGVEEKFDVGIEYVCERHKDSTMIWVYDKFGQKAEYFRDRFKSATASVFKQFTVGEKIIVRTFKEKSEFTVVLAAAPAGGYKIPVIKEVRSITGLGLKDAKDMVEGAPNIVQEGLTKEQAAELRVRLEAAGANVEVVENIVQVKDGQ